MSLCSVLVGDTVGRARCAPGLGIWVLVAWVSDGCELSAGLSDPGGIPVQGGGWLRVWHSRKIHPCAILSIRGSLHRGCNRGKALTLDGWERTQFVREGKSGARGASLPAPGVLLTGCALLPAPVNSPAGTCSQEMGTEKYPQPSSSFLCHMKEKLAAC